MVLLHLAAQIVVGFWGMRTGVEDQRACHLAQVLGSSEQPSFLLLAPSRHVASLARLFPRLHIGVQRFRRHRLPHVARQLLNHPADVASARQRLYGDSLIRGGGVVGKLTHDCRQIPEIAEALERGGLHHTSTDFVGTVRTMISRQARLDPELVKVSRGEWGLAAWYGNRRPKAEPATKAGKGKRGSGKRARKTGGRPKALPSGDGENARATTALARIPRIVAGPTVGPIESPSEPAPLFERSSIAASR
jgi:hypothetical protein